MLISFLALVVNFTSRTEPIRYSLAKENGVYHFVGPDGNRFWSIGVCCVNEGLKPENYSPDNPGYASFRLYKSDKDWAIDTLTKLRDWNINTLGGWSNTSLIQKYAAGQCLPYTVVLHLGAYDKAPWNDIFTKDFEEICDKAAKDQIEPIVNDPLLIGYFSDNELGWWYDALLSNYLAMPPASPGKKHLVRLIKSHYRLDFSRFQKDWLTACHSFDELMGKDVKIWLKPGGDGMQFVNKWMQALAKRYYSVVHRAIRKLDSQRLILGDRYAQYWHLPVVKASKPYIDVVSTNYGAEFLDGSLSRFFLSTLHEVTQKPVIITEFYWNAMENRSGNKNTVKAFPIVQTQQQRAASLSRNLEELAKLPYVIGAHWFQYYDHPEKGRPDGEDNNMGLVDIHGVPYEETVNAIKTTNFEALRAKARLPETCSSIPRAPKNALGGLLNWPRSIGWVKPVTKEAFADLYTCHDDENLYLGLLAMNYVGKALHKDRIVPDSECPKFEVSINNAKPVILLFKDAKPVLASGQAKIKVTESLGIKHSCILALPWKSLGGIPARSLSIKAKFVQHSRAAEMRWSTALPLSR